MKKIIKKIFLTILIAFISVSITSAEESCESYEIGDTINYNGIDFYVIGSSQDYVTLLKAEPLKSSEMINLLNSTEIKDKVNTTKENITMAYYSKDNCVSAGDVSGCTTDYSLSDVKQVIDVWASTNLNVSDLIEDKIGYSVRLITYDEYLQTAEYKHIITEYGYYKSIYDWMYNNNYSYWTMSPFEDSTSSVWFIDGYGALYRNPITNQSISVRPVVNLKKNICENNTYDYDFNKKEYKVGDIVNYKGNKYRVLKSAVKNDSIVTLLKVEPLTVEEVNKYGKDHINMYFHNPSDYQIKYGEENFYYKNAFSDNVYGAIAYYSSETCATGPTNGYSNYTFISSGCTTDYNLSDVKYVLDNWAKNFLDENDLSIDKLGYKYRIITLEELTENLGYNVDAEGNYFYTSNIPRWIYNNYKYFTMTPSDDGNSSMIVVDSTGKINVATYNGATSISDEEYFATIRPVIILKKSTNDEEIVSVPDTLLSLPVTGIIIGSILLIITAIIILNILKKNKQK